MMIRRSIMGRGLAICALAGALGGFGAALPVQAAAPTAPVLGGAISAFAADGGWGYVGQGSSLVVLDGRSLPMQQAAALPLGGPATQVQLAGSRLYVAEQVSGSYGAEGRLELFDLQLPQSPALLGSLALPAPVASMALAGDAAYLLVGDASATSVIHVVDVANPAAPVEQGTLDTGGEQIFDLATDGQLLYGFGASQLLAWDVQHPYAFGGVLDLGWAEARQAVLAGGRAYVLSGQGSDASLTVIDVFDPQQPALLASAAVPGAASLAVEGGLAYVGNADGSIDALDVSDLTNAPFQQVGHAAVGLRSASQLAVKNGQIIALDTASSALWLLGFAGGQATVQGSYESLGTVLALAVSGDIAYMGTADGLRVVSLAAASYGRTLGVWQAAVGSGLAFQQIAVADSGHVVALVADAAGQAGLLVFDVQNPASPQALGSVLLPGALSTLDASGSLALVGVDGSQQSPMSGLYVVSLAQPAAPSLAGTVAWSSSEPLRDVALDGAQAYALGTQTLNVIDLSSAAQPSLLAQASLERGYGESRGLAVQQGMAAVALADGYLFYDLSNAAQPSLIAAQSGGPQDAVAFGDGVAAALSSSYDGATLIPVDLSLAAGGQPSASPRQGLALPMAGSRVLVAGQQAYVQLADGSVRVLALD